MSQTENAQNGGQISGKMFLYDRPQLLSRDDHAEYGINPISNPFSFCANVRAIPLVLGEVGAAARTYPIVFHEPTKMIPLAVVGIVDDVNLFVDDNGMWDPEAYVPAYVRRYPFAVASENGGDRLAIVVDMAFRGLVTGAQTPLFVNGEPTLATQQMIEFCQGYESDRRVSDQLAADLEALDLVTAQQAQFTPDGTTENVVFANYYGIDEDRLRTLSDEKFLQMRRSGLLAVAHAQLWSMGNWRLLMQKRMNRYGLTQAEVLKPRRLS